MKFSVKDFGPIKKAEVDLNNLNILMGDNNGGKTYLSYLLYDALKFSAFAFVVENNELLSEKKVILEIPKTFNPFTSLSVEKTTTEDGIPIYEVLSDKEPESKINKLFNSSDFKKIIQVENMFVSDFDVRRLLVIGDSSELNKVGNVTFEVKNIKERDGFLRKEISINTNLSTKITILGIIFNNNRSFFSSERMGISLFYKALDRNNEDVIRSLQFKFTLGEDDLKMFKKESAYYSDPVSDNIEFTRNIENHQNSTSKLNIDYTLSVFESLIGGKFKKSPNSEITFIYNRRTKNTIDVPLYLASSAARSLSDLYFYLKHLAERNDVIFIDEPESHLTLDRQRIMAKLLVAIANAGVKVWVTTHSDFMVREVNNLIKLSADLPGKQAFLKEYAGEYTEQDCIKPDEVNMYNMVNGVVEKIEITEKGMVTDSFLDIAIHKANTVSMDINYFLAQEEDEVNE